MPDPSPAVLRVEPETIPQLRALLAGCLELLDDKLNLLNRNGRMVDAWMQDPVSQRMRDIYNQRVMDAADGGYSALRTYQLELKRIYDELGRMEAEYRRNEDVTAGLFGSRP